MFASMLGFASQLFSWLAINQTKGSTYPPKCSLLMVGGRTVWQNEQQRSHFLSFLSHQVTPHSISQCTGLTKMSPFFCWDNKFSLLSILPPNLLALWSLYSLASSCRILPKEQSYCQSLKQLSDQLLKFLLGQLVGVVRQPQLAADCYFSSIPCSYVEDFLLDSFMFLA